MSTASPTPSLTPSRSPSPTPPVQPDHFYGSDNVHLPPSPDSDGKAWLDPNDDPLAHRGIPVFRPSMDEFADFEGYVNKIECWGSRSGIVKVIPPKEWTDALPSMKDQLSPVKIKTPIEQHMLGRGGLFRQENIEKRRIMSVREWAELCSKEEFCAPSVDDIGLHARGANGKAKSSTKGRKRSEMAKSATAEPDDAFEIKQEPEEPTSEEKLQVKTKRQAQTRETREANLAERAARDEAFLETFDPHTHWLPPRTTAADYTPEFCQKLERQYWRNCGLGKPAWYGADTQGSLYTDDIKAWNVAHLPSTLSRLLPASSKGLPGVNTPYLYFGMWRATFAWHVEDMDLFSINFIHFGAPKFWYSVPQGRAGALEQTMRGYFPKDTSQCHQFLRHKSFLASPTLLAQSSCRPNMLVQHAGEFVITFPRGYHAGFNLGFNCAESVNFALDSWLELGRRAKACKCISDSVRIDVDQLLRDRENERSELGSASPSRPRRPKSELDEDGKPRIPRKRKSDGTEDSSRSKKFKMHSAKGSGSKVTLTLKIGPQAELEAFPCCLCVSPSVSGLLRVHDPPIGRRDVHDADGNPMKWMAHEDCANVVPETWVDEIDAVVDGVDTKERVVFGVDGIVKDRWNLKCSACAKNRNRTHGAPVQCTKGKCPKAFHVSCARNGGDSGIIFTVLREVEKEVVLLDPGPVPPAISAIPDQIEIDPIDTGGTSSAVHDSSPRVLKVIKKLEVHILCTQHNPAIAAAKKGAKQDKIRNDLLALPSMARIKIRVSAGVFEVTLLRVIEETNSVEVLWDRGVKREFKWGSVVFGSLEGQTVQQKPSELAPEPERSHHPPPATTYSSAPVAARVPVPSPMTSVTAPYAPPQNNYGAWAYQGNNPPSNHYPNVTYNGYYRAPTYKSYNGTVVAAGRSAPSLQWQQPYAGPRPGTVEGEGTSCGNGFASGPTATNAPQTASSVPSWQQPSDLRFNGTQSSTQDNANMASTHHPAGQPPSTSWDKSMEPNAQGSFDMSRLSGLQPAQIASILHANPQLRDAVWAAIGKPKVQTQAQAQAGPS